MYVDRRKSTHKRLSIIYIDRLKSPANFCEICLSSVDHDKGDVRRLALIEENQPQGAMVYCPQNSVLAILLIGTVTLVYVININYYSG